MLLKKNARLMEQLSMGTAIKWHTNTVKPMANGARICSAVETPVNQSPQARLP
jgi:hypothetical protein